MKGFTRTRILGAAVAAIALVIGILTVARPALAQGGGRTFENTKVGGPASFSSSGDATLEVFLPAVQRRNGEVTLSCDALVFADFPSSAGKYSRVKIQFHWDRVGKGNDLMIVHVTPVEGGVTFQVDADPPTFVPVDGAPAGTTARFTIIPRITSFTPAGALLPWGSIETSESNAAGRTKTYHGGFINVEALP